MGACSSKDDKGATTASSANIGRKDDLEAHRMLRPRVLLLGTGGVGKSTIVKQLQIAYGEGFSSTRKDYLPIMHANVIHGLQRLLGDMDLKSIDIAPKNKHHAERLRNAQAFEEALSPNLALSVQALWQDPNVQRCYMLSTGSTPGCVDGMRYLMTKLTSISSPTYSPTDLDILWCKTRTTGIVDVDITIDDVSFLLFDMGGQRTERKKWLHCIDSATGVVFVASLGDFNRLLVEDPSVNRLQESIKVFEGLLQLYSGPVHLILTKTDELQEKLESRMSFGDSFPEFRQRPAGYNDVLEFIKSQFRAVNKLEDRTIQVSTMCGTGTSEIQPVFQRVKATLGPALTAKNQ